MVYAIILSALVLLVLGLALVGREEHKTVMSLEEQAAAELYPTLKPGDTEITADNVRDVIAVSIEGDTDHPFLATRKAGH